MTTKLLIIAATAAIVFGLAGCNRGTNTSTTTNTAAVATPTPIARTNESATTDSTLKTKVEDALKKKGFNDVSLDITTTPAALRGSVPKGKMQEAVQTAQETAGKPVSNQLTEK